VSHPQAAPAQAAGGMDRVIRSLAGVTVAGLAGLAGAISYGQRLSARLPREGETLAEYDSPNTRARKAATASWWPAHPPPMRPVPRSCQPTGNQRLRRGRIAPGFGS